MKRIALYASIFASAACLSASAAHAQSQSVNERAIIIVSGKDAAPQAAITQPGALNTLNPQPLPPKLGATNKLNQSSLNPQPLPPKTLINVQ